MGTQLISSKKYWNLCGEEITQIVIWLLMGEDSLEDINKTFIVIIPKVQSLHLSLNSDL